MLARPQRRSHAAHEVWRSRTTGTRENRVVRRGRGETLDRHSGRRSPSGSRRGTSAKEQEHGSSHLAQALAALVLTSQPPAVPPLVSARSTSSSRRHARNCQSDRRTGGILSPRSGDPLAGPRVARMVRPCPITVQTGENLAGGETSFMFERRPPPFGWRMSIRRVRADSRQRAAA